MIALSKEFVDKYKNKQPNWGFGGLGYIVYKRTYARLKEDGVSEEWHETVERCINGAQKIGAGYTEEEAERIYDYVFNLKCNFAGRMLWQLGTSTVDRFGANSLLNCLKYSTKVLTRQGWKQIGDLAGKEVEIVTKNGKWVTAPLKSYGKQKLMKTVFADKNGNETVIHSTPEHRWFILDRNHNSIETLTKNLENGNKVPVVRGKNSSKEISPQGVQHGLVFGDGSCNGYESHIDLIDNTFDECAKYFSLNRISWTNAENIRHVRYAGMPNYYKQLPDINENKQYLSGFLAGWIAADGSVNKSNGRIRLFNYKKETLEFARDVAAVLGYRTSDPYLERDHNPFDSECETSELWSITFYNSDNPHHLIIRNDHRSKLDDFERDYNNWAKVISNEITDLEEEVYCAEVPDTHSFVIEGNILTGNCWAVAMREPNAFLFLFENLMLGGGVGYSIRREDVHELPKIKKGVKIIHEGVKDADYIVPDKREGWVNLLSKVLEAFYVTGKSFSYSTILIRGYGEPIKGFGGKASGPQVLIDGIVKISKIFQSREGKKLRSIDVLDICNIIGSVVVAGNVRRCLPEGAMVHAEHGLIPIENIKIGDSVLTSYGYRNVNNVFDQGSQNTIIIKTQDGEFECTPNHKMAVLNSVEEYDWVPACELKPGNRLISTRRLVHGVKQNLPDWSYEKPKHSTTCQNISIPELDSDMAWFIGLFHGDGYVYANKENNGFNAYVSLVFGEDEYEIAEKAKSQIERFGVNNVVLQHRKNENAWEVSCFSKQLAYYFHDNIKQPKTEIQVPDFINKSEYDIRLSYVCGVFDSDGCAKSRPVNTVTTVYEKFAKGIQNLLYSCGIESRFERCGNPPSRTGWQELFKINLITNYSKFKISQSEFSLKEMLIGFKSQNSNSYPADWVESHRRETGASSGQNVNVDTYSRYSKIPQEFIPVEVLEIAGGRNVKTYDIEVNEVHEFYCNGYLTHNSAEIALGDPDDILYLRAKNWGTGNVPNWRAMSNNTIYADSYDHVLEEIWKNGYEINKDTGYANGEPYGFFNLPLSQKFGRVKDGPMSDNSMYPTDADNCEMTNPCAEISLSNYECCLTYNTPIITEDGIVKIGEASDNKSKIKVWNGEKWSSVEPHLTRKAQKILSIHFSDGSVLETTEDHRFSVADRFSAKNGYKEVMAKDLDKQSKYKIHTQPFEIKHESGKNVKSAYTIGFAVGDGHSDKNRTYIVLYGEKAKCPVEGSRYSILNKTRYNVVSQQVDTTAFIDSGVLSKMKNDRSGFDEIFSWSRSSILNFIAGLADSDGSIASNGIRIYISDKDRASKAQLLLTKCGIKSSVNLFQPKGSVTNLGARSKDLYYIQIPIAHEIPCHRLIVQKTDNAICVGKSKYQIIEKIEALDGLHDVYCFNEPEKHMAVFNNTLTYQCNLSELYLNNITSKEELIDCATLLYKTQKAIASLPFIHEETNKIVHKNMRLGLGVTGVCQSLDKLDWLDDCYVALRSFDRFWSKLRGWPESIKLTTIKPSGTLSLLGGATPGVHPAFSQYYMRTVRMSSSDTLVQICKDTGYHVEFIINFDGTENRDTVVVYFPCKTPEGSILAKDMDVLKQLDMVKKLQTVWSDNAVSVTAYYKPEELESLKAWLKENYEHNIKSVSFLLFKNHGFKQAPYQEIDEETYLSAMSKVKTNSSLTINSSEMLDMAECSSGACPIR